MTAAQDPPLTRAILLLGDQWILTILQRAFADHVRRFSQWRDLGISESVLADRLGELVGEGIFELQSYRSTNRQRQEYRLTEKGLALWPFLVAIWGWENRWVESHHAFPALVHLTCGAQADPLLGCATCDVWPVSARDTTTHESPVASLGSGQRPRHHRRASRRPGGPGVYQPETLDILGNRWSILVLGLAFLRVRTFAGLKARLAVAPSVLSNRLRHFVDIGVLSLQTTPEGRSRGYRLTDKGMDFFAVFAFLQDWATTWLDDDPDHAELVVVHDHCGTPLRPVLVCRQCQGRLDRGAVAPGDPA